MSTKRKGKKLKDQGSKKLRRETDNANYFIDEAAEESENSEEESDFDQRMKNSNELYNLLCASMKDLKEAFKIFGLVSINIFRLQDNKKNIIKQEELLSFKM